MNISKFDSLIIYISIIILTLIIGISIAKNNTQITNGIEHIQNTSSTNNITKIIINEIILNESKIKELKIRYGIDPKPGNYWYDEKSGLYGLVGHPTGGFVFPHHQFWKDVLLLITKIKR